jgi:uncharacterized BrkB/YihY/UPF0761 family membrane protein
VSVHAWVRQRVDGLPDGAVGGVTVLARAVRMFADDQGLSWAGAIGLYLFLSVPPFVVAAVYLGGLVVPPEQAEAFVLEQVAKYLPAQQELLEAIVAYGPENLSGGALSVALLLFSGSRAFAAMISAVNIMWRRIDALTFWRRQALRGGMLAVTVALLTVAAVAGLFRTPYGELAGVALMATWALVVGVVIVFGAALVAVLDGKRPIDGEDDRRFSRGA